MKQIRTKVIIVLADIQLMRVGIAADWAHVQNTAAEIAPYCADLKRVGALALTDEKFASIACKARQGNFLDTTLPLTDWNDCSLYGTGNLHLRFTVIDERAGSR